MLLNGRANCLKAVECPDDDDNRPARRPFCAMNGHTEARIDSSSSSKIHKPGERGKKAEILARSLIGM
jgi:hypothetical protein